MRVVPLLFFSVMWLRIVCFSILFFFIDAKVRLLRRNTKKAVGLVKRLLSCVNKCCVRTQNLVVNQ